MTTLPDSALLHKSRDAAAVKYGSRPWIKERVIEFDEYGSTKRIHARIRADGYLFYQKQSDYHHALPFADQRNRLEQQFARFAQEVPNTGKWTVKDFDEDFEEWLKLTPGSREVAA